MTPAFFEGPEKKLELAVVDGFPSLRSLGEAFWTAVVRAAQAHVLSKQSNDYFDAYLLSESSLFVYDSFATMITCGQTRLVDAAQMMVERVGADHVAACVYERKREHFPRQQPTSFIEDARTLHRLLPGAAHRFGADHEHAIYVFHSARRYQPDLDDVTIEVLMHGIPEHRAQAFRAVDDAKGGRLAATLGLEAMWEAVPGSEPCTLDEYVFAPAGYSLNGMLGPKYTSLHVTPEQLGSYASFETNLDFRTNPQGLVSGVVAHFEPESFDVVCFVPDDTPVMVEVPGYALRRTIQERLAGYHVTFQHFFRPSENAGRAFPLELGDD